MKIILAIVMLSGLATLYPSMASASTKRLDCLGWRKTYGEIEFPVFTDENHIAFYETFFSRDIDTNVDLSCAMRFSEERIGVIAKCSGFDSKSRKYSLVLSRLYNKQTGRYREIGIASVPGVKKGPNRWSAPVASGTQELVKIECTE